MVLRKLFPRTLVGALLVVTMSSVALAQNRPRTTSQTAEANEVSCSPDELMVVATPAAVETKPAWEAKPKPTIDLAPSISTKEPGFMRFQPLLSAAIDERLGARYRWGATGPDRFDCSGFVWSIYQSVGITFERGSARTLFSKFAPPAAEEQYKFGTLVFFNGLAHVGVVADEHGFYHASRRHGVIYSPFNDYWLKRIDGFRRVPMPAMQITD
jgi:cell wall-associated NlpC family hydrolase